MAYKVICNKSDLVNIANSVRTKLGVTNPYYVSDLSGAIDSIAVTPIEISTDAWMEAVLTSNNVGKVYKFTGTSDTYTNGDLYIVEVGWCL